jgi:hypothetical protein
VVRALPINTEMDWTHRSFDHLYPRVHNLDCYLCFYDVVKIVICWGKIVRMVRLEFAYFFYGSGV